MMAERLKLPWVSTDGIRGAMRKLVRKEDYPGLFDLDEDSLSAEIYLANHNAQQIVEQQNEESRTVWKGVTAFLETDYTWKNYIVEGVAVLPELVAVTKVPNVDLYPIFLVEGQAERIKDIVYTRGVWDYAKNYPDEVKPKEVEWVQSFNDWLAEECKKYTFISYAVTDREIVFAKIIREVESWLQP